MRLLPRSLFSRLVMVMLCGLVGAQILSVTIHMQDRGESLRQSGARSAKRIADVARLLDTSSTAERLAIVNVLSLPPLLVRLDSAPIVPQGSDRATLVAETIRRYLGSDRPLKVVVADVEPKESRSAAQQAMMQNDFSFMSQVSLHDGTLVTFDARSPKQDTSWPYRMTLSLGVLLIAVVLLSLVAVHWATRPLKALADAADELGRDIHRPPMPESGPIEVARATRAFNTMQTRLNAYLRERTSVLAAMSHDLKTPVTRLRLRAELLDDAQLRLKFVGDLEEMESMVGATLDFLRGTGGAEVTRAVDMTALLESLQADLCDVGERVTIEGHAQWPYVGQPTQLKRCLRNLVENATKYGKTAAIEVNDNEGRLQISIRDEGPGIPEAELRRVFDPFYRLEHSRNRDTGGTGLGLTIAKSIAEGHGGQLILENRIEGGLEARVTLPRSLVRREWESPEGSHFWSRLASRFRAPLNAPGSR
jgi:signal transduction histidine kinase